MVPVPCTSAPWPSARPAWAPTTPTPPKASATSTVVRDQGDLQTARSLYERSLAIRETHQSPNRPMTAWIFDNLGNVLYDQGDLDGAHALHERALAIREARLGADTHSPPTASTTSPSSSPTVAVPGPPSSPGMRALDGWPA